jgi:hypothetical protein
LPRISIPVYVNAGFKDAIPKRALSHIPQYKEPQGQMKVPQHEIAEPRMHLGSGTVRSQCGLGHGLGVDRVMRQEGADLLSRTRLAE